MWMGMLVSLLVAFRKFNSAQMEGRRHAWNEVHKNGVMMER